MIKIIQVGMGPIARMVTRYLVERQSFRLVGAVDLIPVWWVRTRGYLPRFDLLA